MFGLGNLIVNTVEGVAQTAVNVAKTGVGAIAYPIDDGKTLDEGMDGVSKGVSKIGKVDGE